MKKFLVSAIVIIMAITFCNISVFAKDNITVIIDGDVIKFDVQPQIINGRTMVPMRKIFEYFGSDVDWRDTGYSQTIYSECGKLSISMSINEKSMWIEGKEYILDVAPTIINSRTLVPLRAVSEAFSSQVEWINETRTVNITTKYPKNKYIVSDNFDEKHIRTSNGDYEYFDFTIDGSRIKIKGKMTDLDIPTVRLTIKSLEDNIYGDNEVISFEKGEEFYGELDLSELDSDQIVLDIWTVTDQNEYSINYRSYIINTIEIERVGKNYKFKKPLVFDNNYDFTNKWVNPVGYIENDISQEIYNLSNEICKNTTNDYDKILKIHDWVADNIYYNYDYYERRTSEITTTSLGVYNERKTVCDGYANLTKDLILAQGIPCRKIVGLITYTPWKVETVNNQGTNHAWVQAYVDNRWVNIDTTWNSGNSYSFGKMQYEGIENHYYFDISETFFALNHKHVNTK